MCALLTKIIVKILGGCSCSWCQLTLRKSNYCMYIKKNNLFMCTKSHLIQLMRNSKEEITPLQLKLNVLADQIAKFGFIAAGLMLV